MTVLSMPMRHLLLAMTFAACSLDDAGIPVDVEILVSEQPGNRLGYWLFEIPSTGGFYDAPYSEIYSRPLQKYSYLGDLGAVVSISGLADVYPGRAVVHPGLGLLGAGAVIPPQATGLYAALAWSLEPYRAYHAVVYQPVPGQPYPDHTLPVTTRLTVCPTALVGARCLSWPAAVRAGWVRCREPITFNPVSTGRCQFLVPHTRWFVHGTTPGRLPIARY